MKLAFYIVLVCTFGLYGQADIYSESDIEFQSLFFDALLAKQKGDDKAQIDALKEIIRRDNKAHGAYYELSKTYLAQDNIELAEKNAIKACQGDPSNQWYVLLKSDIYERSEQYDKAIASYKQLIKNDPHNSVLYHRLALCQLSNQQSEEAALTLESLQSLTGITEETSRRLFDIYSKSGNEKKAIETLKNLSGKEPDNVRYLNNLTGYLLEIDDKEEATKILEKILIIDPENASANTALAKNTSKVSTSDVGGYLQSLMPLIENVNVPLDDKIRELMPHMSRIEKGTQDSDALLNISELLVDQYPDEAKVYSVRADILFYNALYEESEKNYKKAISIDDTKYPLWDQWMINLWQLGNYKSLESVSYDAMDLFPNQVNATIMHAIALAKNNNLDEANDMIDEAAIVAGSNEMLNALIGVGKVWIDNNGDEISGKVKSIDESQLSNPVWYEIIGDIYDKQGDQKLSKKYYQLAIEMGASEKNIKKKMGA